MKNTRSLFAAIVTFALLLTALVGCSGNESTDGKEDNTDVATTTTTVTTTTTQDTDTDPDVGATTDPDGESNTDPDVGATTVPDGEGNTDPDVGTTTVPDGGDNTDPDVGGNTDPDEPKPVEIITSPALSSSAVYVGQKLSDLTLTGGEASVPGKFSWQDPSAKVTAGGSYAFVFTPDDPAYAPAVGSLSITATQLTVNVTAGQGGSASKNGEVKVDYGSTLTVSFTCDSGYEIDTLTVDGKNVSAASSYKLSNITKSVSIAVTFKKIPLTYAITLVEGSDNCYTATDKTITFSGITEDTIYAISGSFNGNIVIDVSDSYEFELELHGFTLTCSTASPITVLGGDTVTITAKKDFESFIYDNRKAVSDSDGSAHSGAIYSEVDLKIGGKGSLTVESKNNNGIHTKDDLSVKNLTLKVTCIDNALKGNDSVTVQSGNLTLIAKDGDGIKTENSDISGKGNQKGNVNIYGGTVKIYAACDGIDAAHDVLIEQSEDVVNLSIFTDTYSNYSVKATDPERSAKGIKADNSITFVGGTVAVQSRDNAVHANNNTTLENGKAPTGNVTVTRGTLTITTDGDALHADGELKISGGDVTIVKSGEGIDANTVNIAGGLLSVTSSRDGISSTATTGTGVTVSAGTVYIYAGGDGIDSNSTTSGKGIVFSGGQTVIVTLSTDSSAITSKGGYTYSAGKVLALAPSGASTADSTNCSNFNSVGTKLTASVAKNGYLTVKVSSRNTVTVKLSQAMNATVIYLASNKASASAATSSSATLDKNGVCWH